MATTPDPKKKKLAADILALLEQTTAVTAPDSLPKNVLARLPLQPLTTTVTKDYFLGPDACAEMLTFTWPNVQRAILEEEVDFLCNCQLDGVFQQHTQLSIISVEETSDTHLSDGQNRCSATVQSRLGQWFTVTHYHVKTDQEARDIFSRIDRGRPRNFADVMRSLGRKELRGLVKQEQNVVGSALRLLTQGCNVESSRTLTRVSDSIIIDAACKWAPYVLEYFAIVNKCTNGKVKRRLKSAPLVAIGMTIMRYNPKKAREFVLALANNVTYIERDPVSEAAKLMEEYTIQQLKCHAYCRAIADAYNHFCGKISFPLGSAERKQYIKQGATTPFLLKNTPFSKDSMRYNLKTDTFKEIGRE